MIGNFPALPPAMTNATDTEVSLEDALRYAIELHRNDMLDAAQMLYQRILEALPGQPDALHFLGVLLHQRGQSQEALALIQQAASLIPNHPDCQINLGNILAETGALPAAALAFERALALDPTRADVHNNLGVVLKMQARWEEAEAAYLRAIELAPDATSAYNNLGLLHAARGRIKEAVHYYCTAIARMPGNPDSRRLLGIAYYTLGKTREAAEVFRQWLEAEPHNPVARHMHAACSGENVPERAPDDYITATFDRFADSFDKQLQENLAYRAPELVCAALTQALPGARALHILDAGCGTGLCGPLLRPLANRLDGVDLSPGMLARADARQCYDELHQAELGAHIAARPQQFDAIISADTLVYFGALEAFCDAARQALRPGGALVFSVEDAGETLRHSYTIQPHGRYAHGHDYLLATLRDAGLSLLAISPATLREEGGVPVAGWIVSATKGTSAQTGGGSSRA